MKNLILLFCLSIFSAVSANAGLRNYMQTNIQDSLSEIGLKDVIPFPIGAAVKIKLLRKSPAYRELIIKEFNSITAENAMKFNSLHPAPSVFRWNDADFLVDFANENNIRVHGHTLIWPRSTPKWVTAFQGSREDWADLLKTHVETIVSHFKGRVASWDVVNEAFDDKGNYKPCIWLDMLGPAYIELAFQFAHEADPDALLFYNDYGHEYGGKKLQAMLNMVRDFKRRGVPISGMGLQMHTVLRMDNEKIAKTLKTVAALGLKVHISELEVSVRYRKPASFIMDSELAFEQALKYKAIFEAYNTIPKWQQFGVTTWNVADADSFRNATIKNHDFPLLFDVHYKPKAAYWLLMQKMRKK